MKNTIITLLGSFMLLSALSSCDETEVIEPQNERVTLNTGADNDTGDDDGGSDGTYLLDEQEAVGVRTMAGQTTTTTVSDVEIDAVDAEAVLTSRGGSYQGTVANDENTAADAADTDPRPTYYSSGGMWNHKRPKGTDRALSNYNPDDADGQIPVMPEDVETRSLRSKSSSMQ